MITDPYQLLLNTITIIKNGDRTARDKLIEEYKPFILKTANFFCKRMLEWGRDDELSIALMAFNSAIDTFNPDKQIPFLAFCRIVILSRLKDHFRKESKHQNSYLLNDEKFSDLLEGKTARDKYFNWTIEDERRKELEQFEEVLSDYSISFGDLVDVSPRHRDYRLSLFKAASKLSGAPGMMEHLTNKKQLPLMELEKLTGIKRKTLERGRKFIIASAIILNRPEEFIYLRSYINFNS